MVHEGHSNRSVDYEDISDNCQWDAVPALKNPRSAGPRITDMIMPITKVWVHSFHSLSDAVTGIVFKESSTGNVSKTRCKYHDQSLKQFTWQAISAAGHSTKSLSSTAEGTENLGNPDPFTETEYGLNESYWRPIASVLQHIFPAGIYEFKSQISASTDNAL